MRESSIAKHLGWGPGSPFSRRLGGRMRQLRIERRMTQREVGGPLSRGFVSAVEHGRAVPSLAALSLMAERLGVSAGDVLAAVNSESPG